MFMSHIQPLRPHNVTKLTEIFSDIQIFTADNVKGDHGLLPGGPRALR